MKCFICIIIKLLLNFGVLLKHLKIFAIFIFIIIISKNIFAQESYKIEGIIIEKNSKRPIPYVDIIVEKMNYGDVADENGYYELSLSPGNYTLIFSMIGYNAKIVEIGVQDNIRLDISMVPLSLTMPSITVFGIRESEIERKKTDEYMINTENVKYQPLNLNDIGRSFKTLPGISSNNGKRGDFNVWGGSPEENILLVDGTRFYHPFHLKEYGNSSISIITMEMIEDATITTGGFTAKYGDALSAVTNIYLRNGSNKEYNYQVETGVIRTSFLSEGPILKKGSWIINANISSFDLAIDLMEKYKIAPKFYTVKKAPNFKDLQGKFFYSFNPNNSLSFRFILSSDKYSEDPIWENKHFVQNIGSYYSDQKISELNYINNASNRNKFFSLKLNNKILNYLKSDIKISYQTIKENYIDTNKINGNNEFLNSNHVNIGSASLDCSQTWNSNLKFDIFEIKSDFNLKIDHSHEIEFGHSIQKFNYLYHENQTHKNEIVGSISLNQDSVNLNQFDYYENDVLLNSFALKDVLYFQNNWQISKNLTSIFGFRGDYFSFNRNFHLSPRISFLYEFTQDLNLQFAYGKYYQNPKYNEFKFQYSSRSNTKDQEADHYLLSVNYGLSENLIFKIESYYKKYSNLISFFNGFGNQISSRKNDAFAFSKGINFHFKYIFDSINGWFSYSYLEAKENNLYDLIKYYPRNTEQTHTISSLVNWHINSSWKLHGKMLYGSGFPYTPFFADFRTRQIRRGRRNSKNLPLYYRLDIRLSRYFNFNWGKLNTYFEIINLTNHKNILGYKDFEFDKNENFVRQELILLPRLPNFGVKLEF